MTAVNLSLLPHQLEFVSDTEHRFLGLVGGYGCGKTYSFCAKAVWLAYLNMGCEGALLEPTFAMASKILVPAFEEMLIENEIPYDYRATPYPTFFLHFERETGYGDSEILTSTIHILSAENYKRIVGLNLAYFGVDEADTIKKDIAIKMWRMLISRLRSKKASAVQGFTTSTPEGFNFLYEFFVKEVDERAREGKNSDDRKFITASTYDNSDNLEPGYIDSLLEQYPENLIEGYLHGKFTNLLTGNVYDSFKRERNNTEKQLSDFDKRNVRGDIIHQTDIHIGIDFNVRHCVGIVHVIDGKELYAVDEVTKQHTDIKLLKKHFTVKANNKNPPVRDRVNSMNGMFRNGDGLIRYFVNVRKCPEYVEALETQGYNDKGAPDKGDAINDHPLDASGYLVFKLFPVRAHHRKVKIIGV